jgi:hypothetical protein
MKGTPSKQILLEQRVAQSIRTSSLTLDELQKLTGIHRAKLGRMRLGKCHPTVDEAESVFQAARQPGRAHFLLACLGDDRDNTPETMSYLEGLMAAMPRFLDTLNDMGSTLNPKWAQGSALFMGQALAEHAGKVLRADTFLPDARAA